ncbi:Lipid storage droplets surface-binding protein 1 [Trachymyrmex cornetzi]|uniref:Lipid storage droplets surface-binding protein 1 n=1 Tax=Trachymyrmex cornetzi TaxID=471704 RepID=A0A195EIZ7_9HYME|nr:Lipid storage droplets surface-binding protein 1 [Trachymyrmex cornetzi]
MGETNAERRHSDLPHFETITKLSSLPIVESGIHIAGNVYTRIKRSNSLMNWSLDTAEQSLSIATATARPAIVALNGPITTIDQLLCKGIDIVEQRVPAVQLPPHVMYLNTRDYVNEKIVKPVLMRAGSVKQIGSQAADAAADRLDGALTVADEYMDRYLPKDPADKEQISSNETMSKTIRTIKHGARFGRDLQRRLTRRTLAEARALKQQGTECVHVLIYVVELIVTDPKLAMQKAKALWASLSQPEPENQARPETLEQLLVLLTRESARRIVHLVNGTVALAARTPRRLSHLLVQLSHQLLDVANASLQMVPALIGKSNTVKEQISIIRSGIERLSSTANLMLEKFAAFLAGRPSPQKTPHTQNREQNHNNHTSETSDPPANVNRCRTSVSSQYWLIQTTFTAQAVFHVISILEKAVSRISHVNDLILEQATNLRDISWNTANQILDTRYGSVAVRGIDNTAVVVDKLYIYIYISLNNCNVKNINTVEKDKLLHTLQTVGHLSNKAARRVYLNIVNHLSTIKKDGLSSYVSSLVEFLRLTKYLHTVNEKPQANGEVNQESHDEKEKSE